MSGNAKTSGVSRKTTGGTNDDDRGRGDSEPKTKKQRLLVDQAGADEQNETDEELYQKAVSLVFGGELYAKLLGYAGPEGIAHLRGDRKWRKAMDDLPDDDLRALKLPVVPRPDDINLTLLRKLLTEPASAANAGRTPGCWTLTELGWKILLRSPLTSNEVVRDVINAGSEKLLDVSISERLGNSAEVLADLVRLGKPDCFVGIARHPAATSEILSAILSRLPQSKLSSEDAQYVAYKIALNRNTGKLDLDFLSRHEVDSVRFLTARNPSTPCYLLRKLSSDTDTGVRAEVARNPETPRDILISLSIDPSVSVRVAVAKNPSAGLDLLLKLALDESDRVLHTLARSQKAHFDLIFDEGRKSHRLTIARYSDSASALEQLVGMEDGRYDHLVACNSNTSEEVLTRLATSDDDKVRRGVAGNKSAGAATLELLLNDDACRKQIARNESTPIHVLETLAKDDDMNIVIGVARNESATREILRGIISSKPPASVPYAVFGNKSLPLTDVVSFATTVLEEDTELTDFLEMTLFDRLEAESDDLPVSFVAALSKRNSLYFQRIAAAHSNLPIKDILRLSKIQEIGENLEVNPLLQVAVDKLHHLLSSGGVGSGQHFTNGEKWW